jgi:hypothetical protein
VGKRAIGKKAIGKWQWAKRQKANIKQQITNRIVFCYLERKAWAFSSNPIPAVHLYFFLFLKEKKKKYTAPIRAIRLI